MLFRGTFHEQYHKYSNYNLFQQYHNNYKLWISNDMQHDINGRIRIIVEDMYGNQMFAFSEIVDVKANSCYNFPNDIAINVLGKNKSECYARIIFMEDDTVLSERLHFFTYPKDMELLETQLNPNIKFVNGKYHLTFDSKVFVKDVYVTASVPGSFSDNFFCILPNVTQTIVFEPEEEDKRNVKFSFKMLN